MILLRSILPFLRPIHSAEFNYLCTRKSEGMHKGVSKVELKKSATSDDDFGKDFFNSWKSAKLGNDSMDFDVETIPKNKKTNFKFDELDNFDLSGNFDKLSSFKLDVPDLDFSGPSKKTEKTNEKSSKELAIGRKESTDDKFSFDFDFNGFDLDSNSPEDKKLNNFSNKNIPEDSSKHEKNQESSDNNSTSTNIWKDQQTDLTHKTEVSIAKGVAVPEDNEKKTCVTLAQREHSHGNYLAKENSDNNQNFCLQSFSGDGSAEVGPSEIQRDIAFSDAAKLRTTKEKLVLMQPISTSPSSSSSPVDSYNLGCWTKASKKELTNHGNELQKHQNQDPLSRLAGSVTSSVQIRKDIYNSVGQKKSMEGVKNIDEKQNLCQNLTLPPEKQNSHQNLMLPSLKSDKPFGGLAKLRGLMSIGLQLKTFNKLEDTNPQQSPAFLSKPINSTLVARTKSAHATTTNETSLQLKSSSESSQKFAMDIKSLAERSLQKPITYATVNHKVPSAGNNTVSVKENATTNIISGTRLCSPISTINKAILDSAVTKKTEVKKNKPNSAKPTEAKSVLFMEKRMECPLNAASKTANPVSIERKTYLHSSLKRKTDEQSIADLETYKTLKSVHVPNASRRIPFESSPNTTGKLIQATEACKDAVPVITAVPELGDPAAEFSPLITDDENLQISENLTKELDKICNILRKEHEDAKEHQVRSIINNNALLLLNFHMLEEKIQAFHKFTASLLHAET